MLRGVMSVLGLEYLKKMVLAGLQLSGMEEERVAYCAFWASWAMRCST